MALMTCSGSGLGGAATAAELQWALPAARAVVIRSELGTDVASEWCRAFIAPPARQTVKIAPRNRPHNQAQDLRIDSLNPLIGSTLSTSVSRYHNVGCIHHTVPAV